MNPMHYLPQPPALGLVLTVAYLFIGVMRIRRKETVEAVVALAAMSAALFITFDLYRALNAPVLLKGEFTFVFTPPTDLSVLFVIALSALAIWELSHQAVARDMLGVLAMILLLHASVALAVSIMGESMPMGSLAGTSLLTLSQELRTAFVWTVVACVVVAVNRRPKRYRRRRQPADELTSIGV